MSWVNNQKGVIDGPILNPLSDTNLCVIHMQGSAPDTPDQCIEFILNWSL
jgi:hypothetical protein